MSRYYKAYNNKGEVTFVDKNMTIEDCVKQGVKIRVTRKDEPLEDNWWQVAAEQHIAVERCECCGEPFELHNMGDHPEYGLCCFECLDKLRKENGDNE